MTALQEAVLEQLGARDDSEYARQTLEDVRNNGASGGFPGFCYYSDTVAFYEANEEAIWQQLAEDADDFGYGNVLDYIDTFPGKKDVGSDTQLKNLLAWYALEIVASQLESVYINSL